MRQAVKSCCKELEVWAGSGLETAETEFPLLELLSFKAGKEFRTWQAGSEDNKPERDAPHDGGQEKPRKLQQTPRGAQEIRTPCWRVSAKSTGTHSPLFSWNYSVSLKKERGKLHKVPHRLQVLSECWPGGFSNRLPVNTDGNQDILWAVNRDNKHFGSQKKDSGCWRDPFTALGLEPWLDLTCLMVWFFFFFFLIPSF